jgi:hypothetical protein
MTPPTTPAASTPPSGGSLALVIAVPVLGGLLGWWVASQVAGKGLAPHLVGALIGGGASYLGLRAAGETAPATSTPATPTP